MDIFELEKIIINVVAIKLIECHLLMKLNELINSNWSIHYI